MDGSKATRFDVAQEAAAISATQVDISQSSMPSQRNIANHGEEVLLHPDLIHIP